MRLSWRDVVATLAVATATVGYLLWETDHALTSWSTRDVAVGVLGLGMVGCTSAADRIAADFGAEGHEHGPMAYVTWMSLVGVIALAGAVVAIVAASSGWLGVLVFSTVVLWISATARALMLGTARPHLPIRH